MSTYDRRDKTAGSFAHAGSGILSTLSRTYEYIRTLDGLFYYRLHGEGSVDDFTGEPVLSPEERKEAQAGYEALKRIRKALDAISDDAKDFDKIGRELDKFMRYT